MSYATIIGLLLLGISYIIYKTTHIAFELMITEYIFFIGVIGGVGLGLILGGFLGWLFKYRRLKKEANKNLEEQDKI